MNNIIEFKDQSMINSWLQESLDLITEAQAEIKATHDLVDEIRASSDGTLVDELVTGSNKVLSVANNLTQTMEDISTTINDVASKVAGFVSDVAGTIGKVFGMFG